MFPVIAKHSFAKTWFEIIDLNDTARRWLKRNAYNDADPNPLLDPRVCLGMISGEHERMLTMHSYGGYMEDRGVLWRGSYIERSGIPMHLGIDVNVPVKTLVAVDVPCIVEKVDCIEEEHGWGGRVIVRPHDSSVVLLYAHFGETRVKVGATLNKGDIIGVVGDAEHNGGWYPHVHVQAIRSTDYARFLVDDLLTLDGYGSPNDTEELRVMFPDPTPWIEIP